MVFLKKAEYTPDGVLALTVIQNVNFSDPWATEGRDGDKVKLVLSIRSI